MSVLDGRPCITKLTTIQNTSTPVFRALCDWGRGLLDSSRRSWIAGCPAGDLREKGGRILAAYGNPCQTKAHAASVVYLNGMRETLMFHKEF